MKKLILAVLLASLSGLASADFSSTNAVLNICELDGHLAESAYRAKAWGLHETKEEKIARVRVGPNEMNDEIKAAKLNESSAFAVTYGYDQAASEQDAYNAAWAKCMDIFAVYR